MKVTSVICEYNPFHLGHAHQLSEMKSRGAVIAVMSGNFTQRGSAAVLSKYERAKLAVMHGADLVLELPFPFCSARADLFGGAGVKVASALGIVDELCFGSESGDIDLLLQTDAGLSSEAFQTHLATTLKNRHEQAHHAARIAAYRDLYGEHTALSGSNDLLALSYLAALREQRSNITPVALRRIGESYSGEGTGFASATSIRKYLAEHNMKDVQTSVPPAVADALQRAIEEGRAVSEDALYPLFAALARTRPQELDNRPDSPAELADRMKKAAKIAKNTEEFLTLAANKRHSRSRVRRGMLYALMDVTHKDFETVPFTTVLAANAAGRELLAKIRKTAEIAIITKPADARHHGETVEKSFSLSAKADSIWQLLLPSPAAGDAMMKEHPRML